MRVNLNRADRGEACDVAEQLATKHELLLVRRGIEQRELREDERHALRVDVNARISRLELDARAVVLSSRPRRVILSPAGRCNLRCTMCTLSHGHDPFPDWTLDDVKRFEPLLRHADYAVPIGVGEPLLVPQYLDILGWLKSLGVGVEFSTNGTLMDEGVARRLVELGADAVSVSLDAATEETYRAIRRNRSYPKLLENIRRLADLRRAAAAGRPVITISAVVQRANLHEMPALARRASELGADRLLLELLRPVAPALQSASTRDQAEETDRLLDEAEREGHRLGLEVVRPPRLARPAKEVPAAAPPGRTDSIPDTQRRLHCTMPWTTLVAWSEFSVTPCCYLLEGFGNARTAAPEELWNGDAMVALREELVSGRLREECRTCGFSGLAA